MKRTRYTTISVLALGATIALGCSDATSSLNGENSGTLVVRLTDAPFLADSAKSVDVFVVRVDARQSDADSAAADQALTSDSSASSGWKTVATPNASINLLSLQNGVSAFLGQTTLAAGSYSGFRLIIDPSKSSVTLKNGQVLSGGSTPGVKFPSGATSGIKIKLDQPVTIGAGATTNMLIDFDVNESFVMRGNSISKNGLLFKPVIKATVTDGTLTNAKIRLANATATPLNLLQNGTALTGASSIAFGASSSCSSVNAATPLLSVTQAGSTTALTGFAPALTAGNSFNFVAYPNAAGAVQFATLSNTYTPTAGQAGLRVFNATSSAAGYDVFVTAAGAALGTATTSNTLAGASSSFVSVPAGASQVRVTGTGSTTVLLDAGAQTFTAGQNATLIIAPPAVGTTVPRAFLVSGC